jgi:hypothetical protein
MQNFNANQDFHHHHHHFSFPPNSAQIMSSTIGIPIKLLHEAQGHVVTVELTNGQVYRGKLVEGPPSTKHAR